MKEKATALSMLNQCNKSLLDNIYLYFYYYYTVNRKQCVFATNVKIVKLY